MILDQAMCDQITKYSNTSKFFVKKQSGCRSGHITPSALLKVTNDLRTAYNKGKIHLLLLLDFLKAFYSVLLKKLEDYLNFKEKEVFISN